MKELADALGKAGPDLLRRALSEARIPPPRRIFVNRALRMETIDFVGFDLDWTLAPYRRLPVQELIFGLSVDRLESYVPGWIGIGVVFLSALLATRAERIEAAPAA